MMPGICGYAGQRRGVSLGGDAVIAVRRPGPVSPVG